ncbi:hypothetical protein BJV77DRAFT_514642 [Russula vinacea]|nr:hypothetical protein BJV77DRAFT_514642 [Russula vinacea]
MICPLIITSVRLSPLLPLRTFLRMAKHLLLISKHPARVVDHLLHPLMVRHHAFRSCPSGQDFHHCPISFV